MFGMTRPVGEASRVHFDHSLNTRLKSWNQLVVCGQGAASNRTQIRVDRAIVIKNK
jgi:hypothetical protein